MSGFTLSNSTRPGAATLGEVTNTGGASGARSPKRKFESLAASQLQSEPLVTLDPRVRMRVICRVRPRNQSETHGRRADDPNFNTVRFGQDKRSVRISRPTYDDRDFRFDAGCDENASQSQVYDTCARDIVDSVLNGFNGTVMAYVASTLLTLARSPGASWPRCPPLPSAD